MRLGVIGAGRIIPFHLDAFQEAGFKITTIGASSNSKNAYNLAQKYKIQNVLKSGSNILDFQDEYDCLLVAPKSEFLFDYLRLLQNSNKPILIEKPVLVDRNQLDGVNQIEKLFPKVMVAFNRRYYRSIQQFNTSINQRAIGTFEFRIPECSNLNFVPKNIICNTLINNTIHAIDLISYLFHVDLDNCNVNVFSDRHSIFEITIDFARSKFPGRASITFGVPGNYELIFKAFGHLLELKPLEVFNDYTGVRVLEPTVNMPIRLYQPESAREIIEYSKSNSEKLFKPGFLEQSISFRKFVETGSFSDQSAKLEEAIKLAKFIFGLNDRIMSG